MESGNKKNLVAQLFQLLFLGCVVLLLGMAINNLVPKKGGASLNAGSYPEPSQSAYPPPPTHMNLSYPTNTPASPVVTKAIRDWRGSPIPPELAAETPDEVGMSQMGTQEAIFMAHAPTWVPPSFPVSSINDLPNVVYRDPFYGTDQTGFGPCILLKNTGASVFVKSIGLIPDYYIVPFFKDNKVCGQALIRVENGLGSVFALGEARGDKFPEVSADEAIRQVQLKTGKQVIGQPTLVFFQTYETPSPDSPSWKVTTSDGQAYFVLFVAGQTFDTTTISVLSENEMHILK